MEGCGDAASEEREKGRVMEACNTPECAVLCFEGLVKREREVEEVRVCCLFASWILSLEGS